MDSNTLSGRLELVKIILGHGAEIDRMYDQGSWKYADEPLSQGGEHDIDFSRNGV